MRRPGDSTIEKLGTIHRIATEDWGLFRIADLFDVRKGKRLTKEDQSDGTTPYVGAIDSNNGISNYIGQKAIHDGGTISLSYNGSVGEAFYQPEPFWATDDVNVLYPKPGTKLGQWSALFICTILRQEKYRYSYGRKWVLESMNDTILRLPKTSTGKPNWQYMSDFMSELAGKENKGLTGNPLTTDNPATDTPVSTAGWDDFRVGDLFDRFEVGKAHAGMLEDGDDCPYLGAKKEDNCVMRRCARNPELVQQGNCIVFICNGEGSVGYVNYMDREFIATTDLVMGYSKKLNQYNGLFITTILDRERPKYSFGRKWKTHLKNTIVRLPKTRDGKPDWDEMERIIKALPYGDRI